jgi:hypothetical protein
LRSAGGELAAGAACAAGGDCSLSKAFALALAMWMIVADRSPKSKRKAGFSREFETRGSDASDRTNPWLTNFLL